MNERDVGGMPVGDRVWRQATREYQVWHLQQRQNMDLEDADWAMNTEDELRPEYLAAAFHAIADYTLLLDAYDYSRGERFPTDRKEDVAGRYGRYMHMLGDVFDARARKSDLH